MKPTREQLERALNLAVDRLWETSWEPGAYCEVDDCKVCGKERPYKCGNNLKACKNSIAKHFLSLAKAKGGKK